MTTWDATAKDLAEALTARGRRPLDADHLFTCAVEALEDFDDWTSPGDLEVTTKGLQADLEEAEKDRDREEKRADGLEKDVERLEDEVAGEGEARQRAERERDEARSECVDLRAVLDGDATLLVDQVENLSRELREERKRTHGLLVQLHARLMSLQQHAAAARISKPTIQVNVRDLVGILDRALATLAE